MLDSIVAGRGVRGIAIGLLEPDGTSRVLIAGTSGREGVPLASDTVFEIGSVTKTFTGALLADAVARGEVKLDDPVARYLPAEVKVPSREGRQITLLDLATHRSGLPRLPTGFSPPDISDPYAAFDLPKLYAWLSDYRLERAPGEKAEYSNVGSGLLGHALVRAAGARDFPQLVRDRILTPLGMDRTGFERSPELAAWRATGHDKAGASVPYWNVGALTGAGGLNSTIDDMLIYLRANVAPPKTPLQHAMHAAQQPRSELGTDRKIGLNWQLAAQDGRTMIIHNGGTGGFSSVIAFDPESGAGVVILANSASFDGRDGIAMQILKGRGIDLPASRLAEYGGVYALGPSRAFTVHEEKGKLYGTVTGQLPLRLFATGKDRFSPIAAGAEIAFERDAGGNVKGLTLHHDGQMRSASRLN